MNKNKTKNKNYFFLNVLNTEKFFVVKIILILISYFGVPDVAGVIGRYTVGQLHVGQLASLVRHSPKGTVLSEMSSWSVLTRHLGMKITF